MMMDALAMRACGLCGQPGDMSAGAALCRTSERERERARARESTCPCRVVLILRARQRERERERERANDSLGSALSLNGAL